MKSNIHLYSLSTSMYYMKHKENKLEKQIQKEVCLPLGHTLFSTVALPALKWMLKVNCYREVMIKSRLKWFSHYLSLKEIQVTPLPQPSHCFTQKLHVASYCYFHQLCTLKKYNIVLNSRTANNGIYNTELKKTKQNSLVKPR